MNIQLWNEDCIQGMRDRLAPESVDLTVTSIPFASLFQYSGKTEDVGNSADAGLNFVGSVFGLHMRFFIEQLFRVHKPGTLVCIHVQQLITYKIQHGYAGRRDFRGAVIDLFMAGGFDWQSEVAIPKNPQAIAQRQKLNSLLFVTGKRDARQLSPAVNDYLLVFKKPGQAVPVPALADSRYESEEDTDYGDRNVMPLPATGAPHGWVSSNDWIKWAHGCWTDIQETDVLDGYRSAREKDDERHVCLARGTLVLTRDGYTPIEEVGVGDEVLTHLGRWRPVLAKACNGPRPVVRTLAQGVAHLLTTPDHPLYARGCVGNGRWPGMPGGVSHPRDQSRSSAPRWMRADETTGSYLNLKLPAVEESPYSLHDWWVVGRWLGDGHFDPHGHAHISCAHEEVDELVALLGERAGAVTERRTAHQIAIKDRDGRLRDLLRRCGRGAGGKRLPGEAVALDAEKSEALLAGYLSADGHYIGKYERWTGSSISRALLLGMAMVAQRARGVVASVYAGRPGGTCVIEGREVTTRQDWVLSIPPRNLSGFLLDDGAWKKVRRVEPAGEAEVWDLQVAEDESFTAEGCIVHNCPLQLEVIRRCIRLYSNPGEVVLDPFVGIGSTCWVAEEQGRNAVGFELKESYYQQALANIEKIQHRGDSATMDIFAVLDSLPETVEAAG